MISRLMFSFMKIMDTNRIRYSSSGDIWEDFKYIVINFILYFRKKLAKKRIKIYGTHFLQPHWKYVCQN